MGVIRDRLWLWSHEAGSHDKGWGISATSRITPTEAAIYMDIPNLIMVRSGGRPTLPLDQYAVALQSLRQVVWSVVGSGGETGEEERSHVLELADRCANVTGVMMDDFFHNRSRTLAASILRIFRSRKPAGGEELGTLSRQELEALCQRLEELDLWVVLYDNQLDLPVGDHLALCDRVSFWTWKARNLDGLERNFERVEELAPDCGKVLGCYMWDYGEKKPMSVEVMERQCKTGLGWLREGRIEGMIFLASCICDLGLEAVEWVREWVGSVGDEPI
jgi:hypothetical protein